MNVQLKRVTRANWEEAIKLKAGENQAGFVPSVAISLAKVSIKPDGDNVDYIPYAIYDNEKMVGFMMHAYVPNTTNMYWINGFLIDEKEQKKGYGKAALAEMIQHIKSEFLQCHEIRLTVYKENHVARDLYKHFGFLPLGEVHGEEDVWYLPVK